MNRFLQIVKRRGLPPNGCGDQARHALVRAGLWVAAVAVWGSLAAAARAQVPATPLGLNGPMFVFPDRALFPGVYPPGVNAGSQGGEPLSSQTNNPHGSNGKAPTPSQQAGFGSNVLYPPGNPAPGQFQSAVTFGGLPLVGRSSQSPWSLNSELSFAQQVAFMQWPHQEDARGNVVAILRGAQVGSPYQLKASSFPFGSAISPPSNDENGGLLPNSAASTYWMSSPFLSTNLPQNYYYSPNAKAVFATQPGQVILVWQKALPNGSKPTNLSTDVGYVEQANQFYILYTNIYTVSGEAVKTPQTMYWTEGANANTGHPVSVPVGTVQRVNFVYSHNFPRAVVPGDLNTIIPVTNTIWFDVSFNQIRADNVQGRIFVELLGEQLSDNTRRFLGFEIVDVTEAPQPVDVTVELGTRIGAYQSGADDSQLTVAPLNGTSQFYYQQTLASGRQNLYATKPTTNLNDFQAYWLTPGVGGLQWPLLFNRYRQIWPSDPAKYVNYVRPAVSNQLSAALTAVQLPANESPSVAYQDFQDLNPVRAQLNAGGLFYSYLDAAHPAHRTLLQFVVGSSVAYERVFSWLDTGLKNNALLAGSVASSLNGWNPTNSTMTFTNLAVAPYVITNTVNVGDRLVAPVGELRSADTNYLAGSVIQKYGTCFNAAAYLDPLAAGFSAANQGAIIPVNAAPGNNVLEVMWFRQDYPDTSLGFQPSYWPSVIGHYNVRWPQTPAREIILASNAGSGSLAGYPGASIYAQNDPTKPGYNPNEEHGLILGGTAYALRDDLNNTNAVGYTSDPWVLISYTATDGRPAIVPFHVRREAPEQGILFDYVVNAGSILQAPMPLPLLAPPVNTNGVSANTAPPANSADLPAGYSSSSALSYYAGFTYEDRKHNFWVYRGLHAGLPALQIGGYSTVSNAISSSYPGGVAVLDQPFAYNLAVSRPTASLTVSGTGLPPGLSLAVTGNGVVLQGVPTSTGSFSPVVSVQDTGDNATATATLTITVYGSGIPSGLAAAAITSTNQYSGAMVTYSNRPPFLAAPPTPTNSFTMQFYYKNLAGFDWPGVASPPAVGAIVPYLRRANAGGGFAGDPVAAASLNLVYRPVWPSLVNGQPVPTLYAGQTLTVPVNNLAAVRGQNSVQVLYQQSIATNSIAQPTNSSVTLFDPTVNKQSVLANYGLSGISGGVVGAIPTSVASSYFQGKYFFPGLPPHLVNRVWLDPNTTNLVFQGQFVQPTVGDSYLFPNILNGADLAAVVGLCSAADASRGSWVAAVNGLAVSLQTFGPALDASSRPIAGTYVAQPSLNTAFGVGAPVTVSRSDQQVDSYALAATGPGVGYLSYIVGNGNNPVNSGSPVTVYVARVGLYAGTNGPGLYPGQLVAVADPNPLSESISFQHTLDLGGKTANFQYDWRIAPPQNGLAPTTDPATWTILAQGTDLSHYTLGGAAGIQSLADNFVTVRYREIDPGAPAANTNWSAWTAPAFAPGYIKRVLAGINPFDQTTSDLFNNPVNTTANIISSAGHRWEGDVALNASSLTNAGLIQVYETVMNRGKALSINAGYNYGPGNDALLLAAGYLCDLYTLIASDASADEANPTISIGTSDRTYGSVATSLFAFQGEEPSLMEEELALLRGRDDSVTTVSLAPVYNRLYWNYTKGIAAGQVIYALNYNILDENNDGKVDAADAAILYPMGHGDAYGHYLTGLGNYWELLMNTNFDWVPKAESVSILGATVAVNYQHERKFASAAGALTQTGLQIYDLTWRENYVSGTSSGWGALGASYQNPVPATYKNGTNTVAVRRYWGMDHWAARTAQGAYLNWVVGNAILPPVDPDPTHQGIQKVDRTTVLELGQIPQTIQQLQADVNNAEAGFTPFDLAQNAIPFDINPLQVTGANPKTHFEQIYDRAVVALNNAVVAFDDAQNVTQELRSEQDSLTDFQAGVNAQELAYNNQLIELYGTPYSEDMGPGGAYPQGYTGPDLLHFTYVEIPNTNLFGGSLADPTAWFTNYLDAQQLPSDWYTKMYNNFDFTMQATNSAYTSLTNGVAVAVVLGPDGFFDKPPGWTSQRGSPGEIQQAISKLVGAKDALRQAVANAVADKQNLDKAIQAFNVLELGNATQVNNRNNDIAGLQTDVANLTAAYNIAQATFTTVESVAADLATGVSTEVPKDVIFGLAAGGDVGSPFSGGLYLALSAFKWAVMAAQNVDTGVSETQLADYQRQVDDFTKTINNLSLDSEIKNAVMALGTQEQALQAEMIGINAAMRSVSDAQAAYQALLAKGQRIQSDRATWRQHAAALVTGYRTRDAAFRLFQNEKLGRYQSLFNLASKYAYMAAQAYDYETGLLGTSQGQAFLKQIISAQALGVVANGVPQYTSSSQGDPGLANALAQMKADWDVLKGRLGFNNPDGNGTSVSLRSENYRVLPGTNGDPAWQSVLQQGRTSDVTSDPDVKRLCLQISDPSGAPVPGIILSFSTTVTDGLNLFGNPYAPGDHNFNRSTFATKIFSAGVSLDGYVGMDNPAGVSGAAAGDPSTNAYALGATPYIYLIPVGKDFMRSPPLGDASAIRSWNVDDVTVPLPFNVSQADFANNPFYTSADSLSEPLFGTREHEAFRPVSTTAAFNTSIYGATGSLQPTEYTNRRLIGRSIWNSKWKLVIPGKSLLNDPNTGLDRLLASLKDIHLYFVTYSYSGN